MLARIRQTCLMLDIILFLVFVRLPARCLNRAVICDRYLTDAVIQLRYLRMCSQKFLERYLKWIPGPDVPIYIRIAPETAYARKPEYDFSYFRTKARLYEKVMGSQPGVIHLDSRTPEADGQRLKDILTAKIENIGQQTGRRRPLIQWAALLVVVIVAAGLFGRNLDDIRKLLDIRTFHIVTLSALILSTQFMNGFRLKILTGSLGLSLTARQWLGIAVVQSFFNYLPMKGGMVANALYLKRRHDFPFTRFASMVGASGLITLLTGAMIGLILSTILWLNGNPKVGPLALVFLALAAPLAVIVSASDKIRLPRRLSGGRVEQVIAGWKIIRSKPLVILVLIGADCLTSLIFALRYYVAFQAFSSPVSIIDCLILAPMSILSTLVGLTPAGLGIREAAVGLAAGLLGAGLGLGIYAASLDRALVMVWVFILGPIFFSLLVRESRSAKDAGE